MRNKNARAGTCLSWINRAFTYNVVKENDDTLARLLKECQDKNAQLANDLEIATFEKNFLRDKMSEYGFTDEDLEKSL